MTAEQFIQTSLSHLDPQQRAKIREAIAKAVQGEALPDLGLDEYETQTIRQIVNEEKYRLSVAGKRWTDKDSRNAMPEAGRPQFNKKAQINIRL